MKKVIAATLTGALLLMAASCGNKPQETSETTAATTVVETETSATEAPTETTAEETTAPVEIPAWEGAWQATDTEEHFEISSVTADGFKVVFWHYEEGQIEEFIYKMEFDNEDRTVASEIGTAQDHGGWEYTFNLNGDSILVQSKLPDQTFLRTEATET